jgi:hypothetical protein
MLQSLRLRAETGGKSRAPRLLASQWRDLAFSKSCVRSDWRVRKSNNQSNNEKMQRKVGRSSVQCRIEGNGGCWLKGVVRAEI